MRALSSRTANTARKGYLTIIRFLFCPPSSAVAFFVFAFRSTSGVDTFIYLFLFSVCFCPPLSLAQLARAPIISFLNLPFISAANFFLFRIKIRKHFVKIKKKRRMERKRFPKLSFLNQQTEGELTN